MKSFDLKEKTAGTDFAKECRKDEVREIAANIDDMTGEELGFAMEKIMESGALDVTATPILMKKGRPAYTLTAIVKEEAEEAVVSSFFKHTRTIGVRTYTCRRYVLEREEVMRETPWGEVPVKRAYGFGVTKEKAEFEKVKAIAEENGLSIDDVKKALK